MRILEDHLCNSWLEQNFSAMDSPAPSYCGNIAPQGVHIIALWKVLDLIFICMQEAHTHNYYCSRIA